MGILMTGDAQRAQFHEIDAVKPTVTLAHIAQIRHMLMDKTSHSVMQERNKVSAEAKKPKAGAKTKPQAPPKNGGKEK